MRKKKEKNKDETSLIAVTLAIWYLTLATAGNPDAATTSSSVDAAL